MKYVLSKDEKELVSEALRQAVIFMEESPREDTPIRAVREAVRVISSAPSIEDEPLGETAGQYPLAEDLPGGVLIIKDSSRDIS